MEEYNLLYKKLQNNTITQSENQRLCQIAFGTEFLDSNDKGTLKEYTN